MTQPRLLFVDDEPNILSGLRRMLRGARREWDISFANSAEEALIMVDRNPVDAVITDMRMPRIDGAELLETLRDRHPRTIRFVLSGQCDENAVFRLMRSSHQFLSKPCEQDALLTSLRRTLDHRASIRSEDLRRLVAGLAILPSPLSVRTTLDDALAMDDTSTDTLTTIAGRDPGFCLKLLQLSCSAYFGIGGGISTPRRALERLGLDTVRTLVGAHDIVPAAPEHAAFGAARQHCIDTAIIAEGLAIEEGLGAEEVELAATASLLSQIGAMILAVEFPHEYQRIIADSATDPAGRPAREEAAFGASQSALGGYLLTLWGLPDALVALASGQGARAPAGAAESVADIVTEAISRTSGARPIDPDADHPVPATEANGQHYEFPPIADPARKGALSS